MSERRLPPALKTHSWTEYGDTVETDVIYRADLLDWLYGEVDEDTIGIPGATLTTPGLVERVDNRATDIRFGPGVVRWDACFTQALREELGDTA